MARHTLGCVGLGGGTTPDRDRSKHAVYRIECKSLLVDIVRKRGRIDVLGYVEGLGVTPEIVRWDLGMLERRDLVFRVHSGALPEIRNQPEPFLGDRQRRLVVQANSAKAEQLHFQRLAHLANVDLTITDSTFDGDTAHELERNETDVVCT